MWVREGMDGRFNDLFQPVVLLLALELHPPIAQHDGQSEPPVNLVVQVLGQKPGKGRVLLQQGAFGIVGYDHGQNNARSQNQNQSADGQKLDQLERMRRIDAKRIELHVRAGKN